MSERKWYPKVIQCCVDTQTFEALSEILKEEQIAMSSILRKWIREKLKENGKF
jgi:hypothetical protein